MPSVETISRAMRRYGCHPDQLRVASPSVRMRTEYPNRLWQADASVCVLYRIRGTGNIGLMKEESYNEKKPENLIKIRNTRIVRYIVVDHCSGNFYLRYEQAAGEDAKGFLDTLIDAMTDGAAGRHARRPGNPLHRSRPRPGLFTRHRLLRANGDHSGATCAGKSPRHRFGRKVSGHRRMQVREPPAFSGSA